MTAGSLSTVNEYVLDLDTAHSYIISMEAEIDMFRRSSELCGDEIDRLHRIVADLRAEIRQREVEGARLRVDNVKLTFALDAAVQHVADLRRSVPETDGEAP